MARFPSSSKAAPSGAAVPTRPMTAAEHEQLGRRARSPAVTVLRVFGALAGLGGAWLSLSFFIGFPYDARTFIFLAPMTGFVGMICAGAASALSRGAREAMKKGEVADLTAVALEASSAPRTLRGVTVGPWTLYLRLKAASSIHIGLSQRVAVATGLRRRRFPGYGWVDRGLLIAVNGEALPSPRVVYFDPGTVGARPLP